ncbi:MAG: hypothetical protein Q8O70_03780 [Burkholderiales bacterium]|nr:hypothetical protein [Burkholderiales bacterium]
MSPVISGFHAITPDLADSAVLLAQTQAAAGLIDAVTNAVAVISALFAGLDSEVAAREFCQLFRGKVA